MACNGQTKLVRRKGLFDKPISFFQKDSIPFKFKSQSRAVTQSHLNTKWLEVNPIAQLNTFNLILSALSEINWNCNFLSWQSCKIEKCTGHFLFTILDT